MATVIDALTGFFRGYALICGVLALGIFFTIRFGFQQFRHFPEFFRSVLRAPAAGKNAITPIRASCTSLALSRLPSSSFAFTSIIGNYTYAENAMAYLRLSNRTGCGVLRTLALPMRVWGARRTIRRSPGKSSRG